MEKRKHLAPLVALFVLSLGCSAPRLTNSQTKKADGQSTPAPADAETSARAAGVMKELRLKILTDPPEEIGFTKEGAGAKVWAVLMDTARPDGVVTVVSFHDGTASIYTTTGGGVLGGYRAKEEAQAFAAEAAKHLARMKPAESFPYPEPGRVKFYVRTPDGVYTAEATQQELEGRRHPLSPLYAIAYKVGGTLWKARESAGPEEGQ